MQVIIGWMVAAVFIAAWVASPADAAHLAGKIMTVTGVTAGAMLGGTDDLIAGFNGARDETKNKPQQDKKKSSTGTGTHLQG